MIKGKLTLCLFASLVFIQSSMASSFEQVWGVLSTPTKENKIWLAELPQRKHSLEDMLKSPITIYQAAKRALSDVSDLFPKNTQKLLRANGICLAGRWVITADTPYTGYFARGAEGLIIARASVGFDNTKKGDYRSFGLAGKIFPTMNPQADVKTAHFFLIDDNAGTMQEHFMDAPLLSEADLSPFNIIKSTLKEWSINFIRMLMTINKAQKEADVESKVRQLYPISRAGLADVSLAKSPALLKVIGSKNMLKVDEEDFRHELHVSKYGHSMKFDIYVSAERSKKPDWGKSPIGHIEFTQDVVSDACDQRLRFAHPWWDPKAK